MTQPRNIDAVFLSFFEDVDRWHNDWAESPSGPTGSVAERLPAGSELEPTILNRTALDGVCMDGGILDLGRTMSLAAHGDTRYYRRYDAISITHLSGTYYESLGRRHGFEVHHANHASRVDLPRLGQRLAPRLVLVSSTFATQTPNLIDFVSHARRAWPGVPVVVGGLFLVELQKSIPPAAFQRFLGVIGADVYCVTPLGESAFLELLRRPPEELTGSGLPACWTRNGRGFSFDEASEPSSLIDDDFVRWDQLDSGNLYHTVNLRTARSCAFTCAFCSYFSNQGPLVLSDPATLERELEHLKRVGHVRTLAFTDDTFNVPVKRFEALLEVLGRFDFEWYSFYRAQFADDGTAQRMADSGCRGVMLGIESLDDRVLKNMQKGATRKAYTRGVAALKRAGVPLHANFIIGFPGDVAENTRELVRFVDGEGVDFFCATPWFCSPATPIHKRREEFGVEGEFYRWKHDTMDCEEAMELERWCADEEHGSVFMSDLGARNFWSQIQLYSNGLDVEAARGVTRSFNRLRAGEHTRASLLAHPELARIRELLAPHTFPAPPGEADGLPLPTAAEGAGDTREPV